MIGRTLALGASLALTIPALAQTDTEFNYQGSLDFQGQPYDGAADFQFSLWNASTGGSSIGTTISIDGVVLDDGLFSTGLDFGAEAWSGSRWLEIAVRTPSWDGSGSEPTFSTLTPRQAVSHAPYSIQTRGIFVDEPGNVGIGTTSPLARLDVNGDVLANAFLGDGSLLTGVIPESRLPQNAIDSTEIQDGSLTGSDIANNSITGSDIASTSIPSGDIISMDASKIFPTSVGNTGFGARPIHVQRYGPFGNGGTLSTGVPSSTWIACVVGFRTTDGDINENGSGDPFYCYPRSVNGVWQVAFDLRSHNNNEEWEIWVMYISRSLATSQL